MQNISATYLLFASLIWLNIQDDVKPLFSQIIKFFMVPMVSNSHFKFLLLFSSTANVSIRAFNQGKGILLKVSFIVLI